MVLFLLPLSSLTLTLQVFASKQPLSPHFFKTTFLPPKKLNNKHSLVYDVVHMFSCFSLPALRIEQSAGSDVPSGKTPPPQGEVFSSFSIFHHHHYPDCTIISPIIIIMLVITTITSSKSALSSALSKLLHSIVYHLHLLIYFLLCHFALLLLSLL